MKTKKQRRLHDYKDELSKGAIVLLSRTKTFEAWANSISDEKKALVCRVFGSLEKAHSKIVSELVAEAISPSPNVVTIDRSGKCSFGWERP